MCGDEAQKKSCFCRTDVPGSVSTHTVIALCQTTIAKKMAAYTFYHNPLRSYKISSDKSYRGCLIWWREFSFLPSFVSTITALSLTFRSIKFLKKRFLYAKDYGKVYMPPFFFSEFSRQPPYPIS